MAYKNLEITAVNGHTNQDPYAIFIPENVQTGTVLGKITGWATGEDLSKVILTPNTAPGSPADDQGRFEIVRATTAGNGWSVGDWIIVVKSGEYPDGSSKFNWEDQSAFANELNFNVTFQAGYTPVSTYGCDYIFNVENVNEAPTNVALSADTVTENSAGAIVGDLSGYDDDDFYWASTSIINYSIVSGLDGAKFQIAPGGKLQVIGSLDYEAADIKIEAVTGKHYYEVIVRASDTGEWGPNGEAPSGTPAFSDKTFRVYVNNDPLDDLPVTPVVQFDSASLAISQVEGNAGTTAYTFTITRSGADLSGDSTVNWAVTGTGANPAAGTDFGGTLPSGSVTFAANETSKTITVNVAGDTAFEPTEQFLVTLTAGANTALGANTTATGTITNDDAAPPPPALSINDQTVTEGNGGAGSPTLVTFTVTRTGDTTGSSTVDWALVHGTTTASDFVVDATHPLNGSLTFLAGETSKTIVLQVNGDTSFEPNEAFSISLSNAANATVSDGTGAGTITNDDAAPPPVVQFDSGSLAVSQVEGNAGTTAYTFTITRSGADLLGDSTVNWAVTGTGANPAAGTDFGGSLPSGSVTFGANEISKTITVNVAGDTAFEPTEQFLVTLTAGANTALGANTTATGTIINDDAAPLAPVFSIAATDSVKAEGDAGYTEFTFTITRSGDTSAASSINWQVQGTGANPTSGGDFIAGWMSGTESFAAGQTSQVITVRVAGDTAIEPDETFSVVLSAPTNGTISATEGSADGTILDDDEHAPTFQVASDQAYFAGPNGVAITGVFAGIDLNDLDGDQLTLTVSFLDANGSLAGMATGGGVTVTDEGTNPQSGIHQYKLVGDAAALEAFLAQRSFTPLSSGASTKFSFTLTDLHHPAAAYGDQITVLGEFPGNHSPVPPSASVVVHEGKGANFVVATFAEFDDENTTIDYQFFGAQANSNGKISGDGKFKIEGNTIVALNLSVAKDEQFTYVVRASDGTYTVEGNVTVVVKNNLAPTIGSVAASGGGRAGGAGTILVDETAGAVQIAAVTATDPDAAQDGRALTYALADTYNGLFAIDADGKIRIADATRLPVNADTPYQLTVQVSDGSDTTTQTVTVKVVNVNHAPAGLDLAGQRTVDEYQTSGTVVGTLTASDDDGNALSYALLDSAGGRFKLAGNQLVVDNGFLFDWEQATSHKVTVQVSDGHGGVATKDFTIGVHNIDPEITGGTAGNDVFYGGAGKDKLYGGAGNDRLFGGGNADVVKGYAGNDTVGGGAGKDALYGGKGKASLDMFVFDTKLTNARVARANVDKIYDFGPKYDSLGFDDLAFSNRTIANYVKKKGGATLDHKLKIDRGWFTVGDKALDRNDFFIYNDKTHTLYFDADGSGHKAMVQVAVFRPFEAKTGALTYKDFFLI